MVTSSSKPKQKLNPANDNGPEIEIIDIPKNLPLIEPELGILISHMGDIIAELAANDNDEESEN